MKLGPVKDVPLAGIIPPEDLLERKQTENVKALAVSAKAGRLVHPILLRKARRGLEIQVGRDRYAACHLAMVPTIQARMVVEATPRELLEAEVEENLCRRHDDKAALLARLVDKAEAVIPDNVSDNAPVSGRKKTTRTKAREVVAAASGKSVEAVRKADERAKARKEGAAPKDSNPAAAGHRGAVQGTTPHPPIDIGPGIPADSASMARPIVLGLDQADRLIGQAIGVVRSLKPPTASWLPAVLDELAAALDHTRTLARAAMPTVVCPGCNGKPTARDCRLCGAFGVVSQAMYDAAPKTNGHAKPSKPQREMSVNGRPLSELAAYVAAGGTLAAGGELRIEREDKAPWDD